MPDKGPYISEHSHKQFAKGQNSGFSLPEKGETAMAVLLHKDEFHRGLAHKSRKSPVRPRKGLHLHLVTTALGLVTSQVSAAERGQ